MKFKLTFSSSSVQLEHFKVFDHYARFSSKINYLMKNCLLKIRILQKISLHSNFSQLQVLRFMMKCNILMVYDWWHNCLLHWKTSGRRPNKQITYLWVNYRKSIYPNSPTTILILDSVMKEHSKKTVNHFWCLLFFRIFGMNVGHCNEPFLLRQFIRISN